MRANKDYYKEEFGAELDELSSTYYALIQAVANVEGVEVRLYEYEDFDGTSLPLRQYEPDRDEPHAIVYVLNDGDAHYALSPHPSLEPDDAEDESEESEDEDNSVSSQESVPKSKRGAVPKSVDVTAPSEGEPPSSIERLKNMPQFPSFFGSSKKSTPRSWAPGAATDVSEPLCLVSVRRRSYRLAATGLRASLNRHRRIGWRGRQSGKAPRSRMSERRRRRWSSRRSRAARAQGRKHRTKKPHA